MSTPTNHWKLGLFVIVGVGVVMAVVVTRVIVVLRFELHVVEHHAKDMSPDVEQLLLRAANHGARTAPATVPKL